MVGSAMLRHTDMNMHSGPKPGRKIIHIYDLALDLRGILSQLHTKKISV